MVHMDPSTVFVDCDCDCDCERRSVKVIHHTSMEDLDRVDGAMTGEYQGSDDFVGIAAREETKLHKKPQCIGSPCSLIHYLLLILAMRSLCTNFKRTNNDRTPYLC